MNPHDQLRAFALVQAAIEQDVDELDFLMDGHLSPCLVLQLVQVAATAMTKAEELGAEPSVDRLAAWSLAVLGKMDVEDRPDFLP